MPALPIPPQPDKEWTLAERTCLLNLLDELAKPIFGSQGISASAKTALTQLLTTPKGVKRYHKAADYTFEEEGEQLDYAAWIYKILRNCSAH